MNVNANKRKQQGVALILSLLLLFVLVILGVAGFSNTHIQERSASNALLQTKAFEAASAGANNSIDFFANRDALGIVTEDNDCGATGHKGWVDPNPTPWGPWETFESGDHSAAFRQRLYCLAPCYDEDADPDTCERPVRSQLFVLSRGIVGIDDDGDGVPDVVLAQRDVEVRLEVGSPGGGPGDGCTAICFPACDMGTVEFPTSNAFQVDGSGEPAITAGCPAAANEITAAIRDNRIGNYFGGIEFALPGAPWDGVDKVEAFRENLQDAAEMAQGAGTCQTACVLSGTDGDPYVDNGNSNYGSVGDPQITYVEGNAEFGGGISGAGILVVNGNLAWNGTPDFKGLILVLGGTFEVIGGGTGGDHGGSVVLLNAHTLNNDGFFGEVNADFTGGGTALYKFDCDAMWAAYGLLDEDGQGMWSPECDVGPETVFQAGPPEIVIASWRENIGWRAPEFTAD